MTCSEDMVKFGRVDFDVREPATNRHNTDIQTGIRTRSPQYFTLYRRRGVVVSGVRRMNEVNARRARLVPGWVTVFGRVYHLGM